MKYYNAVRIHRWICLATASVIVLGGIASRALSSDVSTVGPPPDARMSWFREAKFGMFIHWGLYAQDGCFWKGQDGKSEHMMRHLLIPVAEYEKIAAQFNPVKFDANEWVAIAKAAGMKHMVITSKHHDGFAMFNSRSNEYNIVERTPFKRDVIAELSEACRRQGIRFGVYYSLGRDWHDPDVPTRDGYRSNTWDFPDESKKDFSKYFERKVKPQVRELLTGYGPISILWFDTPEMVSRAQSKELVDLIHALQPECIINQRVGNGMGDYAVAEQKILAGAEPKAWETCMTLNNHWGFHKTDSNWKSPEQLIRNLVDIVSKGGNLLLNVGPTGEGIIPAPSAERLKEMGRWLGVNGESIYGAGATPFGSELNGQQWRCTRAPGRLFIHLFQWPTGSFELPPIREKVTKAYLLADPHKQSLAVRQNGGKWSVALPGVAPDKIDSVLVLETVAN